MSHGSWVGCQNTVWLEVAAIWTRPDSVTWCLRNLGSIQAAAMAGSWESMVIPVVRSSSDLLGKWALLYQRLRPEVCYRILKEQPSLSNYYFTVFLWRLELREVQEIYLRIFNKCDCGCMNRAWTEKASFVRLCCEGYSLLLLFILSFWSTIPQPIAQFSESTC